MTCGYSIIVTVGFGLPRRGWILVWELGGEVEHLWTPMLSKKALVSWWDWGRRSFGVPVSVGNWCFNPLSKHTPHTLESSSRVTTASKSGCNCLWLGGESLSQSQLPCKFKYKYLLVLVYLLMNHDAFLTVIVLDYGTVFVLFMYEYVDAFYAYMILMDMLNIYMWVCVCLLFL